MEPQRCRHSIFRNARWQRALTVSQNSVHDVLVAGTRRSLTATHWQIFMLLYRHRVDVVSNGRIRAELSEGSDQPSTHLITEHMRQLRKVLAGSRYQIVNYRSLGYELVVADDAAFVRLPEV